MSNPFPFRTLPTLGAGLAVIALSAGASALRAAPQPEPVDYLTFAQGALPVSVGGDAAALGVALEHALRVIDGDPGGFSLTPKPGGAEASVWMVYRLPSRTTFTGFVVPNVLETPSPSQTFVRELRIEGSDDGPDGPFVPLARATLVTHTGKGMLTRVPAATLAPVRWVRVSLRGGIDVQRERTFLEFSELVGHGSQEPVALSRAFTGRWRGRGVRIELQQVDARVTGCYDGVGDLEGTVTGNLLRATGTTRDGGIRSVFVLAVDDSGRITGVRSSNGAPFRQMEGDPTPDADTRCRELVMPPLACGAILHGITFDFDSAMIREESGTLLDELARGLAGAAATAITVEGHTSSEGTEAYNAALSERRAAAVVEALAARGVSAERLGARGVGESRPIADNGTEAGRSLNRRVEIHCGAD